MIKPSMTLTSRTIAKVSTISFIFLLCSGCVAQKNIQVQDAWCRPANEGENSAVYMTILNPTSKDDTLLSATCDEAEMTEIHMSMMDASGTTRMEKQETVSMPAHSRIEFQPGGLHIMLMGVKKNLRPSEQITIHLHFQKAGKITFSVPVK